MKTQKYNLGVEVKEPAKACDDMHCPFHNGFKVKGRVFTGTITKLSGTKTASLEFLRQYYLQKYERFEKRKTRIHVHNTPCISLKIGDVVKVMECRPISKMKNFVVIENEST